MKTEATLKTYATKSNAARAARSAGFHDFEVVQTEDSRYTYKLTPVVDEFALCPHCGVHLENGVADGETLKHFCMRCGEEFGEALVKEEKPAKKQATKGTSPRLNHSTVQNPCRVVWDVAHNMHKENPNVRRKDVVQACIDMGIATHTARTQYQAWYRASKNSQRS